MEDRAKRKATTADTRLSRRRNQRLGEACVESVRSHSLSLFCTRKDERTPAAPIVKLTIYGERIRVNIVLLVCSCRWCPEIRNNNVRLQSQSRQRVGSSPLSRARYNRSTASRPNPLANGSHPARESSLRREIFLSLSPRAAYLCVCVCVRVFLPNLYIHVTRYRSVSPYANAVNRK